MKVFNLGEMLHSSATSVFKSLHVGNIVRVTTDRYYPANGVIGSVKYTGKGNIEMKIYTNIDTTESNIMGIKPIELDVGDFIISSAIKWLHDDYAVDNNMISITYHSQFDLLVLTNDHNYKILDITPLENDACIEYKRINDLVDFILKSDYQSYQAQLYREAKRIKNKIASGDVFRNKNEDLILLNIGSDVNASMRYLDEQLIFDLEETMNTISVDSAGYIIRSDAINFSTFRKMINKGMIERYRRLTADAYLNTVRLLSIDYRYRFRESDFINI